jgi:hypothetical protein
MHIEYREQQLKLLSAKHGEQTAEQVRFKFEREAEYRSEREVWSSFTRAVVVSKAYVAFSGLVKDSQFSNLGIVLLGILADVVKVVGLPELERQSPSQRIDAQGSVSGSSTPRTLTGMSTRVTGVQMGDIVERQYDSDDVGEVVERKPRDEEAGLATPLQPHEGIATDDITAVETQATASDNKAKKKTKQKKGWSDIDDLFAGLT